MWLSELYSSGPIHIDMSTLLLNNRSRATISIQSVVLLLLLLLPGDDMSNGHPPKSSNNRNKGSDFLSSIRPKFMQD